jgi:hypothetical protein
VIPVAAAARPAAPRIATSPAGRGVAEIGVMKDIGAASTVLWQLSARFPAVFDGAQPVLVPSGPGAWSVRVAGLASLRDAELDAALERPRELVEDVLFGRGTGDAGIHIALELRQRAHRAANAHEFAAARGVVGHLPQANAGGDVRPQAIDPLQVHLQARLAVSGDDRVGNAHLTWGNR